MSALNFQKVLFQARKTIITVPFKGPYCSFIKIFSQKLWLGPLNLFPPLVVIVPIAPSFLLPSWYSPWKTVPSRDS